MLTKKYDQVSRSDIFRVSTMNVLHNPIDFEERIHTIWQELTLLDSDTIFMQEVNSEYIPLLNKLSSKDGYVATYSEPVTPLNNSLLSSTAVFVKNSFPVEKYVKHVKAYKFHNPNCPIPTIVETEYNGYKIALISAHFPWGSNCSETREKVAESFSVLADKYTQKGYKVILGGDFNETPDGLTVKYLRGQSVSITTGCGTFWTDSWLFVENAWSTASKEGKYALNTARNVGVIFPELMPERVIDYLMSYGWNFGKVASPLKVYKTGVKKTPSGEFPTDHYGLSTDFFFPVDVEKYLC